MKKMKESGLRENIQIYYKGLGLVEAKTAWSNNLKKKNIPELQDRFIEIIKLTKQWHVLDEPPTTYPHRIEIPMVRTLSNAVNDLDRKAKAKQIEFNKNVRKEWQRIEYIGDTSVLDQIQQLGKRKIDYSFVDIRIEYLSEFYIVGEGNIN